MDATLDQRVTPAPVNDAKDVDVASNTNAGMDGTCMTSVDTDVAEVAERFDNIMKLPSDKSDGEEQLREAMGTAQHQVEMSKQLQDTTKQSNSKAEDTQRHAEHSEKEFEQLHAQDAEQMRELRSCNRDLQEKLIQAQDIVQQREELIKKLVKQLNSEKQERSMTSGQAETQCKYKLTNKEEVDIFQEELSQSADDMRHKTDDSVHTPSPNITKDEMLSDVYKMDHPRRGKALIINNKTFAKNMNCGDRKGTDVDATNIFETLKQLEFYVKTYTNVTSAELKKYLHETANENHADADCFVCVILSHGNEGVIFATDGRVDVNDIVEPFNCTNCESLVGKPKLFFIQACRGVKMDQGVSMKVTHDTAFMDKDVSMYVTDAKACREKPNSDTQMCILSEGDFLVAYSTVPGFFSWRNQDNGSWFIQALARKLSTFGTSLELLHIMTMVNSCVAIEFESNTDATHMCGMKQVPSFTTTLAKDLYFIPKVK